MENSEEALKPQEDSVLGFPSSSPSSPLSASASAVLPSVLDDLIASPVDDPATVENPDGVVENVGLEEKNDDDYIDNGDKDGKDEVKDNVEVDSSAKKKRNRKRRKAQRAQASDCWTYLRTGTCRYKSNCKFNHPVKAKNQEPSSVLVEPVQVINEEDKKTKELIESPRQQEYHKAIIEEEKETKELIVKARQEYKATTEEEKETKELIVKARQECQAITEEKETEEPMVKARQECKVITEEEKKTEELIVKERQECKVITEEEKEAEELIVQVRQQECKETDILAPRLVSPESVQVITENENKTEELIQGARQGECKIIAKKEKGTEMHIEREKQECKYYLRPGGCKFGKACRYNHLQENTAEAPLLDFNCRGLPIRPVEKECLYYMYTGFCKYGTNCWFHHPDTIADGGMDSLPGINNIGSVSLYSSGSSQPASTSWSSLRTSNATVPKLDNSLSYSRMMLPPPQGVKSYPKWNRYQAPMYSTERCKHPPPASTNRTDVSTHHQQQMLEEFPERPDQPNSSDLKKNEDCKYRSTCNYNHLKNSILKSLGCVLSPTGLPLRPDQSICAHYNRYGICKLGPACKFDHPVEYAYSAPSSASMPS